MSSDLPVPSWKPTRQPAVTRVTLTRDVIVDVALRLLDRDGLDGVTMRRVADELNTGAASLYAHVANKDELLDLVLDKVHSEIEIPDPDPARWQEQVREVGMKIYEVYRVHRDIALVNFANVPTGPNALRSAERILAILIAGGVPPRMAAWALDRLALYVSADAYEGSIFNKRRAGSGLSLEEFQAQYGGGLYDFFSKLPADRFPTITKYLAELTSGDGEERFEFGLDMIIRSLASYAAEADR